VVLWALCITVVVETVPLIAVLLGAPDLKTLLAAPRKIEYFLEVRGGRALAVWVSLAIAVSISMRSLRSCCRAPAYSSVRAAINLERPGQRRRVYHPSQIQIAMGGDRRHCRAELGCLLYRYPAAAGRDRNLADSVYALLCNCSDSRPPQRNDRQRTLPMPLFPWPAIAGLATLGYIIYQNLLDAAFAGPA